MSHILIVEPELSVIRTLQSSLESLPDECKVKAFAKGPDLLAWLTRQIEKKKDDADFSIDIRLIVLDSHMVKGENTKLIEPIHKKIVEEELTNTANPCGFVFTFYESEDFHLESYIHPLIYNVIFKPFDPLLLKESLKAAIHGRHPVQPEVYVHDARGRVEILKDITTTAITELGFRTQSAREIPIGKKARYYSDHFREGGREYVYAYCYANRPDPESPEHFLSSFAYFGISPDQLRAIRRFIHAQEDHHRLPIEDEVSDKQEETIAVVSTNLEFVNSIRLMAQERFKKLSVLHMPSFFELNVALGRSDSENNIQNSPLGQDKTLLFRIERVSGRILQIQIDEKEIDVNDRLFGHSVEQLISKSKIDDLLVARDRALLADFMAQDSNESKPIVGLLSHEKKPTYFKVTHYFDTALDEMMEMETDAECSDLILALLSTSEIKAHLGIKETNLSALEAVYFEVPAETSDSFLHSLRSLSSEIKDRDLQTALFAIAKEKITTYENLRKFSFLDDYIVQPLDSFYFSHKLKQLFPHLTCKSPNGLSREAIESDTVIQTALPVQVQKISELHISIVHNRALRLGDVRRFVLFTRDNDVLPAVWGACNYITEQSPGEFLHEFIFFGVTDRHLKFIRNWMKSQYIQGKSKG